MVELESGGMPHRGKSIAGWHMDRNSKKCSNREDWPKRCQKDIQNVERDIVEYWSRKSRYA